MLRVIFMLLDDSFSKLKIHVISDIIILVTLFIPAGKSVCASNVPLIPYTVAMQSEAWASLACLDTVIVG